jgi:hypothetical protein
VVKVEWAFVEAFDNAERTPLALDQIATLDAHSRLSLQPHVQLLALDYKSDSLVLDLHKEHMKGASEAGVKHEDGLLAPVELPRLRLRPTWVAAHRLENAVYYRRLEREEFFTLGALRDGATLGDALEAGLEHSTKPESRRPALVRTWFTQWAALGWICAQELESLLKN